MACLSYCARQVRRLDYDRFLCALFAPAEGREALFALYAFNAEVARIREAVSEPLLGQVRLQWWRDAVAGIYAGTPPRHQVARPLAEAVERFSLDRAPFERLLDARAFDIEDGAPADLKALVAYAEDTSATLTALSLDILGARDEAARRAGRHIGIAWALTGLARAVPFHAGARRVYLPATLCRDAGVDFQDLFRLRPGPGLTHVVAEIADTARRHLDVARRGRGSRRALPALLPAVLAEGYVERLRKAGFNPFARRVQAAGAGRVLALCLRAALGRY